MASDESTRLVTSMVEELLSIEQASAQASFRELGGNSLQAVELVYRLRPNANNSSSLMRTLFSGSLQDVAAQLVLRNEEVHS